MNPEDCQRYLEDPEANAAHLAGCAECRALAETLDEHVETSSVLGSRSSVDELPLAAWEGASQRSWPLVAAGAIAVAVIAALLFAATGTSPLEILRGNVPPADVIASLLRLRFVQNAPLSWQIFIAAAFIVVNGIFFALLRRAPRGLDV
ncbi:MAG TPA: hypothetical protein VF980_03060 [Thermoanaerobaculia bacterium]